MTFVTTLTFTSGDRAALEDTVGRLKETLRRKGVECTGPHTQPSETVRVPLSGTLGPGEPFDRWTYEVYARELSIHGSDQITREITESGFHDAVHVEIEVDRKRPLGEGRN